MRIWSILLIKADLKWCIYLSRSLLFYLGNNALHLLTLKRSCDLRIEMTDFDNTKKYAEYKDFKVGYEKDGYKLNLGKYSGNAGKISC